jgi:hypothetical protein
MSENTTDQTDISTPTPKRGRRAGLPGKTATSGANGAPTETKPRKARTPKPRFSGQLAAEGERLIAHGFDPTIVHECAAAIDNAASQAAAAAYDRADLLAAVVAAQDARLKQLAASAAAPTE